MGEQQYHDLNMQLHTAESKLQRVAQECRCQRGEEQYSSEFRTLKEQYDATIKRLDEQCNQYRKDKKSVEAGHADGLKQKRAFVQLEKLMNIKLKVAQQELHNIGDGGYGQMPTRTVMDSSTVGV